MFIINTTFAIDREILEQFVEWLKQLYVPAAMATGLFSSPRIARLLSDKDPHVVSLACEFACESLSEAVRWHDDTALLLRNDMSSRWGERVMFFTSYLRKIDI